MSTWWVAARRADIFFDLSTSHNTVFNVTNRGWYYLYDLLKTLKVKFPELAAGKDAFVPTKLATSWGDALLTANSGDWLQLGKYDGRAVVPGGIVHKRDASKFADSYELTTLSQTPLGFWINQIGQDLAVTMTGLVITGRPMKGNSVSVNLTKGAKVNLTKEAGGTLTKVRVGLGWDVRATAGDAYDLDASVIALDATGKSPGAAWFVFYNNLKSPNGEIQHQGDNLSGAGDGDDEQIVIDLAALPATVDALIVAVTIYDARTRGGQQFSLVDNAFVRVIDESTGTELSRFDLSEDAEPGVNSLVFAKLYRNNDGWALRAVGDGFKDELDGLTKAYAIA